MATIILIIGIVIGVWVFGATDSLFLGFLGFLTPIILLWVFVGLLKKGERNEEIKKETEKKANIEKGNSIIQYNFMELLNSAPPSPTMYNIVTIQDTTLKLYLGKFKIWRKEDTINILAFDDNELREALGSGKIKAKNQLYYRFNVNKVSLFERENTEQIITKTHGGGSKFSIWTGNEKVGRVYTTEHMVGNKCTLLYVEGNPVDIKIMFSYEDYSVLNRLINKES
ncbi:MAG: hypothetical protein J1E36_00850 [Eubacterium sp.]|nr:hypothetical protein [Eubacterium sp.]